MQDSELLFLISQPRSGSTLLQNILGNHEEIHTISEPWVMLHLAYSLKNSGIYTEYGKVTEFGALSEFVDNMPKGGRKYYLDSLREFCLSVYGPYLEQSGKRFFLDKTPRYYFIIDELLEIFPNARFIVLRRHPLSVLYSIVQSWTKEAWYSLSDYKSDLIAGFNFTEGYRRENRVFYMTYEHLVNDTPKELERLCTFIEIEYNEQMLYYNHNNDWKLGDQSNYIQSGRVDRSRQNRWESEAMSYQLWRVLADYLEWIGKDKMDESGYDYKKTKKSLFANCPAETIDSLVSSTFSLESLLNNTKNCLYERQQLASINTELRKEINQLKRFVHRFATTNPILHPITSVASLRNIVVNYRESIKKCK